MWQLQSGNSGLQHVGPSCHTTAATAARPTAHAVGAVLALLPTVATCVLVVQLRGGTPPPRARDLGQHGLAGMLGEGRRPGSTVAAVGVGVEWCHLLWTECVLVPQENTGTCRKEIGILGVMCGTARFSLEKRKC